MILGVSVILLREDGKILTIEEAEKKPWKEPGDFSIPMETKLEDETYEDTVDRAIREEARGITEYRIIGPIADRDYNILNIALVRCFLVEVRKHENLLSGIEVANHRWMFPEEFLRLKKLRPGARGILEYFIRFYPLQNQREE